MVLHSNNAQWTSDVLFWLLVICNTTYHCKTTSPFIVGREISDCFTPHLNSTPAANWKEDWDNESYSWNLQWQFSFPWMVSKLKLAVTSTEGTNNGFRVPSIAYDLSFAHLLSTHDKVLPFEQKLRYKKSHIRGGGRVLILHPAIFT